MKLLKEEELLEKKKRKWKNGLSITPFVIHKDAGDVEAGINHFNSAMTTGNCTGACEALEKGDQEKANEIEREIQWYEEKEDDQPYNAGKYATEISNLKQELKENTMEKPNKPANKEAIIEFPINMEEKDINKYKDIAKEYGLEYLYKHINQSGGAHKWDLQFKGKAIDLFNFVKKVAEDDDTFFYDNFEEFVDDVWDIYPELFEENLKESKMEFKHLHEAVEESNYILEIGIANNNGLFDKKRKLFKSEEEAKKVFDDKVEQLIKETVDNNELNADDAVEYREEVEDSGTGFEAFDHVWYLSDPDDEWYVLIDQIFDNELEETLKEDLNNVTEVEDKAKEVMEPAFASAVREIRSHDKEREELKKVRKAPKEGEEVLPKDLKMNLEESLFTEWVEEDEEEEAHIVYIVHSDIDENNIKREFNGKEEAIEYAKENAVDETWVDEVTIDPKTSDEYVDTIWVYDEDEIEGE